MIIACDIDGCLLDIAPEINFRTSEHFNIPLDLVKKDKYYMHEIFGIDFDVMNEFLHGHCFNDPDFWLAAEPFKENIKALKDAWWLCNEIVLVTGRSNDNRYATEMSLMNNSVVYDTLLMSALDTKHTALKYIGADMMIEDRFNEAKVIAEKGFKSYVLRREYNIEHETQYEHPNLFWVDSVGEAIEHARL